MTDIVANTRGLSRWCAAALVCVLWLSACQTTQQFTRPDGEESLALSGQWYRLSDREGDATVFRARHQTHELELKLEKLSTPLRPGVPAIWTRAWLANRYGPVQATPARAVTASGRPAEHFTVEVPGRELRFEYASVNWSGTTYLLSVWGSPAAFDAWDEGFDAIVGGLDLPENTSLDSLACRDQTQSVELQGLAAELPSEMTDGEQYCDVWNTQGASQSVEWSLDSRLITGMLRTEQLPYALDPAEYRDVFLERTDPTRERTTELDAPPVGVAVHIERPTDPISMTDVYVFVTRGERGWLLQLSTPAALMDDNRGVFDAIIDSLRLSSAD